MAAQPRPDFDPDFASTAEWAAMYRACGLQVVPCHMPQEAASWKRPKLADWADLQEGLISDAAFALWYGADGSCIKRSNMGIITGRASGNTLVIDLDEHKNAAAMGWWRGLIAVENNNLDLDTVEQRTGGGGRQKLFRYPADWHAPTNRTALGVDIRGQGGFAVLAPSRHESGQDYAWLPGRAPWEIEIAEAPQWLLDAIEALVEAYGGDQGGGPRQKTNAPASDVDAFGNVVDGREALMARTVWREVLQWYRECPIEPPFKHWFERCEQAYLAYERKVTTRLPGDKRDGLEQEGRGASAFWRKWKAVMRHWGSPRMIEEAAKPAPKEEQPAKPEPPKLDPQTGQPLPLILTDAEFMRGFVPPDYLIDGMLQRGYLYSLTARTGHGKTAVVMLAGAMVAQGKPFHSAETAQGGVLFLAGENPDDIRARYAALADTLGFAVGSIPFHFIDGVVDLAANMERIKAEAAKIANLTLVIVDTKQAYFLGDDSNSNEQNAAFAQLLRSLIKVLSGHPAVVVNCHPIKNAAQDNLVPLGGSAFLNEVDANLTLWAEDKVCTLSPHNDKWRGVAFESVQFELRTVVTDALKDTKGRHIPSVIAVPITEMTAEMRGVVAAEDEKTVLRLIHADKQNTQSSIAKHAGWFWPDGRPARSKVQKIVARLRKSRFVYEYHAGKYRLTKKGCKLIGVKHDNEEDGDGADESFG
jgi:AAA domain-containing protein/bifunctional DNA primase/polymerase-like protein